MNDAYGDPRNYDPNVYDYNPYEDPNVWGNPAPPTLGTGTRLPGKMVPEQVTVPPPAGGGKTPAQIEAEGRDYDARNGLIGGYMLNGVWVNGSPHGGGGGGGGDYRAGGAGGSGQFDYGRPLTNQFTPYSPLSFQPFDYEGFTPSNRDMLYDEKFNPGFTRSQERLRKMIEAGAAYQGVLRSGNTFDRLGSILANNEESAFKAFDDRRARDYGINRSNKFESWGANLGVAERENQAMNNYRFNTEQSTAQDILSRWAQLVNSATQLAKPI